MKVQTLRKRRSDCVQGLEQALREVVPGTVEESETFRIAAYDRFAGYKLRGLWFRDDNYGKLRNASWLLRNSRAGQLTNPAALALVVHEAEKLMERGQKLGDVLEAFAELLIHP